MGDTGGKALLLKNALELLKPPAARRAECELRVEWAHNGVRNLRENRQAAPGKAREQYRQVAKVLRKLEALADEGALFFWPSALTIPEDDGAFPRAKIRECRERYEMIASGMYVPRKSGPQENYAATTAFEKAHKLLVDFGHTPTKTRGGAWHALGVILFDDPDAELYQAFIDFRLEEAHSTAPSAEDVLWRRGR
jgi:hypothetical protein